MQVGQGPGLSAYVPGQVTGVENVTLNSQQIPAHVHGLSGSFLAQSAPGGKSDPTVNFPAPTADNQYSEAGGGGVMGPNMIKGTAGDAGGNQRRYARPSQGRLKVRVEVVVEG